MELSLYYEHCALYSKKQMPPTVLSCASSGFGHNLVILLLWTLTSFLCHYMGKQFLTQVKEIYGETGATMELFTKGFVQATILTALQMAFITTFVNSEKTTSPLRGYFVRMSHVLASLATNLSLANMFAASTFALKMMEPITSAFVQSIIMGKPMTCWAILSLPFIAGGAIVFSSDSQWSSAMSLGALMAIASNILLSLRNTALKQSSLGQDDGQLLSLPTKPREWSVPLCLAVIGGSVCYFLETRGLMPPRTTIVAGLALGSALAHVAFSYLTIGVLLKHISAVSHVGGLLVVLCLYCFEQRQASGFNFIGLLACTLSLIFYTFHTTQEDTSTGKQAPNVRKRCIGVTIIVSVCIVTFLSLSYGPTTEKLSRIRGIAEPKCSNNSDSDSHSFRSTFGPNGLSRPTEEELHKVPDISSQLSGELPSFLNRRLINTPEDANFLSRELTNVDDIIRESQRLHFNIFGDALNKFKYAMIFDIASFENKGDPCITVGEIYFLRRMNIEILYYCNFHACVSKNLDKAKELAQEYGPEQLAILVHGGGNIIGYPANDFIRFKLLDRFPTFQMFVFPQSIWISQRKHPHVQNTINHYCCHPNLTLVLRDQLSYETAKTLYNGTSRLLMAPDMAFQIGRVARFMSPVFDILWLKRADGETPGYLSVKNVPKHLRVHISDWWRWMTPAAGSNLEKAFYISANGFFFLQRGRVIITDRLHGHILSTLMDIPHVLIDNKAKKLSSYHNTWTKSLHNTVLTDNPDEALDLAIALLEKFNQTLPPVAPYLSVTEDFSQPHLGVPIMGYP